MLLHIRFAGLEAKPDDRVLFSHRTNGYLTQVSTGSRRFLRNPSCTFAPVSDSGRTDYVSPNRHFSADPTSFTMRSPTMRQFHSSIPWLKYLLFTLHNQGYPWLCKTHFRLMVSLYRVGVEPTGFQRMISVHRTSHILRLSLSQERPDPSFSNYDKAEEQLSQL